MAEGLDRNALENLDKQTLITLLMTTHASLESMQKTIERLNKNIDILTEEVRSLRTKQFGRHSEKNLVDAQDQLYISFNEAEIVIDLYPVTQELEFEEIHPKAYKRGKKAKGKREEDLKDLPTEVVEHTMSEEELAQAFPSGKYKRLPDEVYKRLEYQPAGFKVTEHHVAVYAAEGNDDNESVIIRADRPADLLRNSVTTASLMAAVFNYKFVNSQPIHRMVQEFERQDVHIPTQNVCRWVIECSNRYLKRIYDRLKEKLFEYHVVHADETPVEVRKDGRPAGSKSYMWVYRSGALESNPFVLYDYQKTRKADHPREFLKGFKGYCLTDGYQVYHTIDRERDDITVAGCWAHARRGFADVIKASPKDDPDLPESVAYKALQIIQTMYRYEKAYADKSAEERKNLRTRECAPLVDAFFAYLKAESQEVAEKSKTGKAIAYCLNQEKYLRVFLSDPMVPMDNNAAERGIRTFCLGKHNWYMIDTVSGAEASAIAYSIAETARANDLKPYEYFKYLLEEIPKHGEFEDRAFLDALLPWSETLPEACYKTKK